jgi:hypothetical protein
MGKLRRPLQSSQRIKDTNQNIPNSTLTFPTNGSTIQRENCILKEEQPCPYIISVGALYIYLFILLCTKLSNTKMGFFSFPLVVSFLLLISEPDGGQAAHATKVTNIGGIIDVTSRIGKEQKIAIEIAAENFNRFSNSNKLSLHFQDSSGLDPFQVASAGQ